MKREIRRWEIMDLRKNKKSPLKSLIDENGVFMDMRAEDYCDSPLETAIDRSDVIYAIAKYRISDSFGYVRYSKESDVGHELIVIDDDLSIKDFLLLSDNGDEFDKIEFLNRFGFQLNPDRVDFHWTGKCSVWIMEGCISYFLRKNGKRIIFKDYAEASTWIFEKKTKSIHPAHHVDFLIAGER